MQDKNLSFIKKSQRGIAVMLALITIMVLGVLAAEMIYETQVYRRIIFNSVDRVQSYYLAKTGLKLARLQLLAAKKAKQKIKNLGANSPVSSSDIESIWKLPLTLPPPVFPDASLELQLKLEALQEELGLNGTINISISGESGKISLNFLVWKYPQAGTSPTNENPMRKTIVEILDKLMKEKREEDNNFLTKYEHLTAFMLIENLLAWMDPNITTDGDGLPKELYYQEQEPAYHIKNAPLYSLSELRLVKGFDDDLVKFFEEHFSATLSKGININTISKELLKAIFPLMGEESINDILEKRAASPFSNVNEFWKYVTQELGDYTADDIKTKLKQSGITLTVDESSYRAIIQVDMNNSKRTWIAYFGLRSPDELGESNSDKKPPAIVYLRAD